MQFRDPAFFNNPIKTLSRRKRHIKNVVTPFWVDDTIGVFNKGVVYSDFVAATSPSVVSYSISSGSLPAGISLSTDGVMSGTPTTVSTYSFTVRAANQNAYIEKSFSVSVGTGITGGSSTVDTGGYRYHIFNGNANLVSARTTSTLLDFVVVGGGASGGSSVGGGGGAGSHYAYTGVSFASGATASIIIGAGGARQTTYFGGQGFAGTQTTLTLGVTYTSLGGGGGGYYNANAPTKGSDGGSGGGGSSGVNLNNFSAGGAALAGGSPGGSGANQTNGFYLSGGGGGGGSEGTGNGQSAISGSKSGNGGLSKAWNGYELAGGGGGGGDNIAGSAGGGGSTAGKTANTHAVNATANTGSGGGGTRSSSGGAQSGAGGSGVVIVRYLL